ncbi:MAG: hypothetical protein COA47_09920 [Robiginitomaculum sp.]|nr:MAG: hypothetical protein COA47_09920 [Robiginitomaculum sp.]
MANFTGYIVAVFENGIPVTRAAWLGDIGPVNSSGSGFLASVGLDGTVTPGSSPYNTVAYTGYSGGGYADIFYNRILLEPSTLNLGNLVSNQVRSISVFNGFLTGKTLTAINTVGGDGISLTGDTPPPDVEFAALQERTYNLEILVDGPPSVSASFTFVFTGIDDPVLSVTGSRIVVLPYYIQEFAGESLAWLTNIMTARDGTEQRVQGRKLPRQNFTTTATISPNELNRVDNLFYGWRDKLWALPVWTEGRLASPVLDGDMVITVNTLYGDFRVGELAMIWSGPRNFDAFEILAKSDNDLTLGRGVTGNFPSGIVLPVRIARLVSDPRRNTNGFSGEINTSFTVKDNPTYVPEVSATTHNGVDVYVQQPLRTGGFVSDTYNKLTETVDYKTGVVELVDPWTYTKINRQFSLVLDSLQQVWEFKSWLAARKGRLVPFYMPTFEDNLPLLSTGFLTSPIVVSNHEQAALGSDRTTIAVNTKTGWLFRDVIGYSVDGNGDVVVSLSSGLLLDADEVNFISFMGLKRLTSDTISMTWRQNFLAQVVVPITEITP